MAAQVFGQGEGVPGGAGLLHADAHPGNMLLGERLALIDFDRCGFGPFLLDIAGTVLDMERAERAAFLDAHIDSAKLRVNRDSTACHSIPQNPYSVPPPVGRISGIRVYLSIGIHITAPCGPCPKIICPHSRR
ncbi:phosphotransferase [Deinococcus sp.]|uniref:phosphotransferase n=1 Tax=Deinococcus sp. TaxID=47478 RepID=UPI003C7D97F8